ncbi:MAG: type II toxin-antitoxin system prevent-host-death family antitoxin [Candidatus Parabeggiatoa sp. nov. 3]|nr:MAG: type II toxin-antitoxin system prevent-host-death family antitoxin [Gammaproteobacteria bacterium]RKZ67329.1 MAG: type II toxin-antitoxin system prevent-host-death family antitoxin [Gammaproteobacteria bacterium]RKZ86330.1 MAG: type II toxin-antitoxin system prevent-host-death family antitoxin [Gammaproteobacteria bacterium]
MTVVSATQLKTHLFEYLEQVQNGDTIVIKRHKQEVARLIPSHSPDWRDRMRLQPKLNVSVDELIMPLSEIWEDYV